jgi:hypothetical protein
MQRETKLQSKSDSWVRLSRAPLEETDAKGEVKFFPMAPGGPRPSLQEPDLKGLMVRRNGLHQLSSKVARLPVMPPLLLTTPTFDQVLRFTAAASSSSVCGVGALATACGGLAGSTTAFYPWCSSIRIKSVHIWPSAIAVASAAAVCSLKWAGAAASGYTPEDLKDSSIPAGITITRPGKYGPPVGSLANNWLGQALQSDNLFTLQVPEGSVIDVHVLCRMNNTLTPFGSSVVVAATAGLAYWGHLDGTSANFSPLSRPTISGI